MEFAKTMKGNEKTWDAAFKSKNARVDGHFSWRGTDAFLSTDHGIRKALAPRAEEVLDLVESWRAWRGYAVVS